MTTYTYKNIDYSINNVDDNFYFDDLIEGDIVLYNSSNRDGFDHNIDKCLDYIRELYTDKEMIDFFAEMGIDAKRMIEEDGETIDVILYENDRKEYYIETLCNMLLNKGINAIYFESCGYCQGDYAEVLAWGEYIPDKKYIETVIWGGLLGVNVLDEFFTVYDEEEGEEVAKKCIDQCIEKFLKNIDNENLEFYKKGNETIIVNKQWNGKFAIGSDKQIFDCYVFYNDSITGYKKELFVSCEEENRITSDQIPFEIKEYIFSLLNR